MKGALTLLVLAAGHQTASAVDGQGVSCWQNHVDFRGDDIERADGSTGGAVVDTALECQSLCQRHFPCTHWTWRFEGKCFMKSGATTQLELIWLSESQGGQQIYKNRDYVGSNWKGGTLADPIHISEAARPSVCRAKCAETRGCTAWSMRRWKKLGVAIEEATPHGTCYLKEGTWEVLDEIRRPAYIISGAKDSEDCGESVSLENMDGW